MDSLDCFLKSSLVRWQPLLLSFFLPKKQSSQFCHRTYFCLREIKLTHRSLDWSRNLSPGNQTCTSKFRKTDNDFSFHESFPACGFPFTRQQSVLSAPFKTGRVVAFSRPMVRKNDRRIIFQWFLPVTKGVILQRLNKIMSEGKDKNLCVKIMS